MHCFAGISRSATIIIAYLMRYHNMDLREAHAFVRKQRSFICPNHGFMGQLRRYESFLKKKRQEGEL